MAESGTKPVFHNFQALVLIIVQRFSQKLISFFQSHIGKHYLFILSLSDAYLLCMMHKKYSQRVI